ncbi:MAG: DUF3783 domain-containing protein [Lachnospiraceae bacterium]|nr:DUF3783 domain-containing protein [Lachnospiraceae bacterium]
MKPIILLYNFSGERLRNIRKALAPLDVKLKSVAKGDYSRSVGFLAEQDGIEPLQKKHSSESFTEEMIVMCGLRSEGIDTVIALLNKNGVGSKALKAVITESNSHWDSVTLYKELKKEHDVMNG